MFQCLDENAAPERDFGFHKTYLKTNPVYDPYRDEASRTCCAASGSSTRLDTLRVRA